MKLCMGSILFQIYFAQVLFYLLMVFGSEQLRKLTFQNRLSEKILDLNKQVMKYNKKISKLTFYDFTLFSKCFAKIYLTWDFTRWAFIIK